LAILTNQVDKAKRTQEDHNHVDVNR
jgi:hypothetical protein